MGFGAQSSQLKVLHRFGQIFHLQVHQVNFFVVEFGNILLVQLHCLDELGAQHGVDLQRRLVSGPPDLTLHSHLLHLDGGDGEEDSCLTIASNRGINAAHFSISHFSSLYLLELIEEFVFKLRPVFLEFFETLSHILVMPDFMNVVMKIEVEGNADQLVGLFLDVGLGQDILTKVSLL